MEGIRLGVHACIIGESVQNKGKYKGDRFLRDTLGRFVEYVPVFPEEDCGLEEVWEELRLEGEDAQTPRLRNPKTEEDFTDRVARWARRKARELEAENLCGFVFRGRSPITGMERVTVHTGDGNRRKDGVGLFASILMEHFPFLPVEEDGRLHDPGLRENFIERIFVFKRWQELPAGAGKLGPLVDFHTRHKLLILAHSPKHGSALGRLVARAKGLSPQALHAQYLTLLMEALRLKATTKKHTNVLHHLMGYFKKDLTPDEKQELLEVIGQYHQGGLPLIVPITLMNHYIRKYDEPYLKKQVYLEPHPLELKLRNHA
jgi:uncharacterized protein YbgA (DUF1722 family)/uncharacterized protein YbbK (DUF523 family)